MGDRNGRRIELTRIATWWSGFTALTGWCRSFFQMAGARFLFGIGAAGAYPNAAGAISEWLPKQEPARAQGFVWGASRLGRALARPSFSFLGWTAHAGSQINSAHNQNRLANYRRNSHTKPNPTS